MIGNNKWASIRWRIVMIYFLLVFIAMIIVSVFIINQLEVYQLNSVRDQITKTVETSSFLTEFSQYDNLKEHREEIQATVDELWSGYQESMFVFDTSFSPVASSNSITDISSEIERDYALIEETIANNEPGESNSMISGNIPVKNVTIPIEHEGEVTGVIYVRADVSSTFALISQSKSIFVRAILLALLITVFFGFLIAGSITVPINDVTEKAQRMAQGDFSQEVSVKSDDEIGRLAEMFNLLRGKLDYTLSEMSNEKSKLETILRYMADGLIAAEPTGRIIHVNPAARAMLNIEEEDVQARTYDELISSYDENLVFDALRERGKTEGGQATFQHKGSTFAARYEWFKGEDNADIGIIMIIQDITERQKLEKMQTDFVANVSHELKTPLTTIKSYTETLLDGGVDDEELLKSFLSIINTEADRMSRLVKDLLQLSRLDYQQEQLYKKDSNVILLLKTAITKVEVMASQKQQHLNCFFDPEQIIMANIDKDNIEQVMLNILSNAIKYTQEGGRIDIDVMRTDHFVHVIVTDNGIGMSQKEIPRVFERFYRVDKARSRAEGGTGLGLAIAKQIMEAHGGNIEIESQEGKGTKASIILPLVSKRGLSNIE